MEKTDGQETVVEAEVIETEPTETGEEVSHNFDDGIDTEEKKEEPEKKEESVTPEEEQDGVQKRINKIHREKKEAEERLEAERKKREELEVELKKFQETELPPIPEIPDYLDPNYDDLMHKRDDIIKRHAQEASKRDALAAQQASEAQAANDAHKKKVDGYVKAFDARIDELKLDKATVVKAEEIVGKYINHQPGLAEFILSDSENGPLNVQYLSQNIDELEKVSQMSATSAAAYIATKVAPEAQKLKPKQTKAPEPPYDPDGNRRKVENDPRLAGATFE